MSIGLYFGSSTGNTEEVANKIASYFDNIDVFNIFDDGIEKLKTYDNLILGTPTWGDGELQDDWDEAWKEFCNIDFSNKNIALFGLGDQDNYGDEFCNALGTIYTQVKNANGNIIGFTSTNGYTFDSSTAVVNNEFVGLIIDEDNQDDLTNKRIENWVLELKKNLT